MTSSLLPVVDCDTPWFLDHPGPSAENLRVRFTRRGCEVLTNAMAHPSCQVLLDLVLGNDKPLFVAWGLDLRLLYNDACSSLFQGEVLMGQRMRDVWGDRWHEIGHDLARLMQGGHPRSAAIELGCGSKGHPLSGNFIFDCSPVNGPLFRERPLGMFCACRRPEPLMLHGMQTSSALAAPTPADSPLVQPGALQVLIADDHLDAAETLAMLLGLEGHVVEVARNGQDALDLAARLNTDVAILDIELPGLDGYTVAQRIRQTKTGESMLLLALTGRGDVEDKERARMAGFDEHFTKPVDPPLLLGCIAAWKLRR